jgi:hypothetical protein
MLSNGIFLWNQIIHFFNKSLCDFFIIIRLIINIKKLGAGGKGNEMTTRFYQFVMLEK